MLNTKIRELSMAFDIIGDIYGQADKLHALLGHLG